MLIYRLNVGEYRMASVSYLRSQEARLEHATDRASNNHRGVNGKCWLPTGLMPLQQGTKHEIFLLVHFTFKEAAAKKKKYFIQLYHALAIQTQFESSLQQKILFHPFHGRKTIEENIDAVNI